MPICSTVLYFCSKYTQLSVSRLLLLLLQLIYLTRKKHYSLELITRERGNNSTNLATMTEHLQAVISSKQPVVDYGSTTSSTPTPSTSVIPRAPRLPSFVLINESASPNRYTRMSHNKLHGDSQERLERVEYFLNVLNQMCIGFITIYISYITLRTGLQGTSLHAWLVTIGVSA